MGSLIYLSTETNSHLPNTVKCKNKLSKDCKPGKHDSFIPQKYARHPNYKPWVTKEPKHDLSLKINKQTNAFLKGDSHSKTIKELPKRCQTAKYLKSGGR